MKIKFVTIVTGRDGSDDEGGNNRIYCGRRFFYPQLLVFLNFKICMKFLK